MSVYKYQAFDRNGAKVNGELESVNEQQVRLELQRKKLIPTLIKEVTESTQAKGKTKKVGYKELEYLTNELSLLLSSGIKIDKSLSIIARSQISPSLSIMVKKLLTDVKSGVPLSECFAKHPNSFDNMYCNLIRVGEATGELPQVFAKLAEDIHFKSDLRSKIVQALVYPGIISFICISAIVFILNYVIPQMSSLFENAANLPVYTAALLGVSDWFVNYQWYLLIVIVAVGYFVWTNRDAPSFKNSVNQFMDKAPLLQNIVIMVERIRFTSAMSLMLSSGVNLTGSLSLASDSVKSESIRASLISAIEKVKQGQSLTVAMGEVSIFSGMYLSLIEIGEETSELQRVFTEISQRSQNTFETWVAKATNLLEPLLIVVMGLIVGTVVVIMLLSVTSVNDLQF